MNSFRLTALVTILLAVQVSFSSVLYEQDFSIESAKDHFVSISGNNTKTVSDGVMEITNDTIHSGILLRNSEPTDFTLSAQIATDSAYGYVGLCFGWKQYDGYVVALKTANEGVSLAIGKMVQGSYTTLKALYHAHINADSNLLTVSKQGSDITVLVNGVVMASLTDSDVSGGDFGFFIDAKQSMIVDNLILSDQFIETGDTLRYYENDFSENVNGLNVKQPYDFSNNVYLGDVSFGDGVVTIQSGDQIANGAVSVYTEGMYTGVPCKVRARYISGDKESYYGINLVDIEKTFTLGSQNRVSFSSNKKRESQFVIDNSDNKSWSSASTETSGLSFISNPSTYIHGRGEWDTLEITADYAFKINGHQVLAPGDETIYDAYNAAGFIVHGGGTVVEFDNFTVGDSAYKVGIIEDIARRPAKNNIFSVYRGDSKGVIYNANGQIVKTFKLSSNNYLSSLPGGNYFVMIQESGKQSVVKKLILTK